MEAGVRIPTTPCQSWEGGRWARSGFVAASAPWNLVVPVLAIGGALPKRLRPFHQTHRAHQQTCVRAWAQAHLCNWRRCWRGRLWYGNRCWRHFGGLRLGLRFGFGLGVDRTLLLRRGWIIRLQHYFRRIPARHWRGSRRLRRGRNQNFGCWRWRWLRWLAIQIHLGGQGLLGGQRATAAGQSRLIFARKCKICAPANQQQCHGDCHGNAPCFALPFAAGR